MTPELPRAPIRLPWAAMRAILLTSVALESLMSSTADCSVSSMLVPLSPSGTGNTFSRLTSSWLAASQLRDPSSACLKSCPSTLRGVVSVEDAIFVHPLHVYVHLGHGNADGALDLELDRLLEVVRDLRDPGAVLDDHVDVDGQRAAQVAHLHASVRALAVEELADTVAEAAGRHSHDAVTAGGGVAGDGGDGTRKDVDPAPLVGTSEGALLRMLRCRGHDRPNGTIDLRRLNRAFNHGQKMRDLR